MSDVDAGAEKPFDTYLEELLESGRFIPRHPSSPQMAAVNTIVDAVEELRARDMYRHDYMGAVQLNPTARKLFAALDRETSIRWEDLPDRCGEDWTAICKAVAVLSRAGLCEADQRLRISVHGIESTRWLRGVVAVEPPADSAVYHSNNE